MNCFQSPAFTVGFHLFWSGFSFSAIVKEDESSQVWATGYTKPNAALEEQLLLLAQAEMQL